MCRSLIVFAALLLALPPVLTAQEADSGLQLGQYIPGPFHVYTLTGEHAGRQHCLVCANGLRPAVMLFTREAPDPDKPLGQLLKQLDALLGKYPAVRAGAFVVVLGDLADFDKRQALAGKVADAAKALGTQRVDFALDAPAGPAGYKLDPANRDVVVFYHKHKVLANFTSGAEGLPAADVGKLVQEVEKTLAEINRHVLPGRPGRRK